MLEAADKEGFAVVYPSSHGAQGGDLPGRRHRLRVGPARPGESVACIDPARVRDRRVDRRRDGRRARRLRAEREDRQPRARLGRLPLAAGLQPRSPLSILEIHGTADTTVPYEGRGADHAGAVLPYVVAWATRDRCGPSPTHTVVARHTLLYRLEPAVRRARSSSTCGSTAAATACRTRSAADQLGQHQLDRRDLRDLALPGVAPPRRVRLAGAGGRAGLQRAEVPGSPTGYKLFMSCPGTTSCGRTGPDADGGGRCGGGLLRGDRRR